MTNLKFKIQNSKLPSLVARLLNKPMPETTGDHRKPMPRHADFSLISHFAESFNRLRTSIRFARLDNPAHVLLVTGSVPGEGKTTVAVNLAESIAYSGQKVLLVECDLRRPSFKDVFSCNPKRGVSTLISEVFDTPVQGGTLGDRTLGDLMTLIDIQEQTGVLTVSGNGNVYEFVFQRGRLASSTWKNRPAGERLASVLVSNGAVTAAQAKEALARAVETGQRLGFILVNMGLVTPEKLRGPLRLQITDNLSRAFNISGAKYAFEKSPRVTFDVDIVDPIKVRDIMNDGMPGLGMRCFLCEQIHSFMIDVGVENLRVLPGGATPPNPSEMLGSKRMATLMTMLRESFDYDVLVIDSPPITSVTDAVILSALADGVIMVIGAGRTDRAIIGNAIDQLKQANAPLLGFVLNRMDPRGEKHYYSYYQKYYKEYFEK